MVALARKGTQDVAPAVPASQVVTPPAPGFAPAWQTPRNQTGVGDLLRAYDALFGKTALRLGPSHPRWSTFSGEMNPEAITSALQMADSGQPFQFHDMCRRAVEQDAAIGAATELAFSSIVSEEDRIEPPRSMRRDPLAISLANWQRAVREQVEDFDRARYALLWAEGVGYACSEIIWGHRPITWFDADGERITRTYCVPIKLEIVDGRAFRFDTETDEPLLWLQGDYCPLPPAKFVWHEAYRTGSIRERGGFMRACLFLHAIKQWAWRDMAEYLHMYGLPQMIAEYDREKYTYEEARSIARQVMEALGEGGVPTTPMGAFGLRTDTPPPQWALVHGDAAKLMNAEIFRRISLGLLTMTDSGGSYGLGDIHARGAFAGAKLRAHNLCQSFRKGFWAPTVAMNVLRLAPDVAKSPTEIMCALADYRVRLLMDDTPEARQKVFSQAALDGVEFSKEQYRAELHLDEPKDKDDIVRGEAQSIPSSGATVSAIDAAKGATAPDAAGATPGGQPIDPAGEASALELTATAQAAIVTVNEAREQLGLGPIDGGDAFIIEHIAKHSGTVAEAAHAEAGGDAAAQATRPAGAPVKEPT